MMVKLGTIKATTSGLESVLKLSQNLTSGVATNLEMALGSCQYLVAYSCNHVQRVKIGSVRGRIRHLFSEQEFHQCQRNLDSHISMLGVLMNAIIL